jgi:hypothetical protein
MIESPNNSSVARCIPIETQHATLSQFDATNSATKDATNSLKALASLVLKRNTQRNQSETKDEKPRNFDTEKTTQKLHGVAAFPNAKTDENLAIKCADCLNFIAHNKHGKGSGYCAAGCDPRIWSETERDCEKFDPCIEWVFYDEPQGETVTCFTPNGAAIEVEARDVAHSNWLKQMNPKR